MMFVPRFSLNLPKSNENAFRSEKPWVRIKDHGKDEIIGLFRLFEDDETNMELCQKIIETIEEYISENDGN